METSPNNILEVALQSATANLEISSITDPEIAERIHAVAENAANRACVRVLLACALAKTCFPHFDIRAPYTEIGDDTAFSGRYYDETFVSEFILRHQLPCNSTTAFLTPALRNRDTILSSTEEVKGRPRGLYQKTFRLLEDVQSEKISAEQLLTETIRVLLKHKQQRASRMDMLLDGLKGTSDDYLPLSSEAIVGLITNHLSRPRSSRLPVLVVAAAYKAAQSHLGEGVLPLQAHNAADEKTGALGDVEITILNNDEVVTSYEMKMKKVTRVDIDNALTKMSRIDWHLDNYIFITTEAIDEKVLEYATSLYEQTGGIEIAILDCIDFIRHFLHLFHRIRTNFLDIYQEMLLAEPESAVRQELKEVFLVLRRDAESLLNY